MIWDFLVVQWLKFCASNAGDASLIPGWGNMIPHAKKRKEEEGET